MKSKNAVQLRKAREKEQRIQDILITARELFSKNGFQQTTMDEIALAAGFSKPTLYQYFLTKDDLYAHLLMPVAKYTVTIFEELLEKVEAGKYHSGKGFVKDLFKNFLVVYESDPEGFIALQLGQQTGLILELTEESRKLLVNVGKDSYEIGRQIVKAAMIQGLLKKTDVHLLTDVMWGGLFVGVIQTAKLKMALNPGKDHMRRTLNLAEKIFADAVAIE